MIGVAFTDEYALADWLPYSEPGWSGFFMWNVFADWQLAQLERLAQNDPERVETMLNTLWASYPGLYEELLVAAVDQEQVSVADAAERLGLSAKEVEERLLAFRQISRDFNPIALHALVETTENSVARLSECRVAVWEVVREYRKLGSVERLRGAFPSLGPIELAAALEYGQAHPAEIEAAIERYETIVTKRRVEYPFSRS